MKTTIGKKMTTSFSIVLFLVVIALVFVVFVSNRTLSKSKVLADEKFPVMMKMEDLKLSIYNRRVLFDQFLTTRKPGILKQITSMNSDIQKAMSALGNDKSKILPLYKEYNKKFENVISYIKANPSKLSNAMRKTAIADKYFNDTLVPAIDKLVAQRQKETDNLVTQIQASLKNSQIIFIVIGLIIIVLGFILSTNLTKSLTTPIKSLTKVTDKISMGDFDANIEVKTGDEIEELANAIDRMKRSLQKAMERLMNR